MAQHVTVVSLSSGLADPVAYENFLNDVVGTGTIEWIFTHGQHVIVWKD